MNECSDKGTWCVNRLLRNDELITRWSLFGPYQGHEGGHTPSLLTCSLHGSSHQSSAVRNLRHCFLSRGVWPSNGAKLQHRPKPRLRYLLLLSILLPPYPPRPGPKGGLLFYWCYPKQMRSCTSVFTATAKSNFL